MTAMYVRLPPVDAVTIDGETVLLFGSGRAVHLASPIAVALLEEASHPASLETLVSWAGEHFAGPADGRIQEALQTIIDELIRVGALARVSDG